MTSVRVSLVKAPGKAPTGITGFDEITGGGLPHGLTTLLVGGPGSGKTVLALQFLVHGAQALKEPGIFVAFEETSKRVVANAASFGWKLAEQRRTGLFFLDAQPMPDVVHAGDFDLSGMLAALEAQTRSMGARRIVFDALNVVLELLPDPAAKRRELYRLNEWLLATDRYPKPAAFSTPRASGAKRKRNVFFSAVPSEVAAASRFPSRSCAEPRIGSVSPKTPRAPAGPSRTAS